MPPIRLIVVLLLLASRARAECAGGVCWPSERPHPAVVRIVNDVGKARCYGSGTVVKHEDRLLVLTCAHLFREGTGRVAVGQSGAWTPVQVLGVDNQCDLAALEAPVAAAAPTVVAQQPARPGDPLTSCGYGPDGRYRVNRGRALGYAQTTATGGWETLSLSGSAREGDSGGPVFNQQGELVAVLWGTDGRTVEATYCGRIRLFLAGLRRSPAAGPPETAVPPVAPVAPPPSAVAPSVATPALDPRWSAIERRLDQAEHNLGEDNLRRLIGDILGSTTATPSIWEAAIPAVLAALGWTGPPAIAAVIGLRIVAGLLRRRKARKRQSSVPGEATTPFQGVPPAQAATPLDDDYAKQLAEVYALSGRSSLADATLGREYDQELRSAEQSSDGVLASWARRLRERVARRFFRIHGRGNE